MNNSMVAHLWANEKEESARGSNLFFEGRSIYSYGYHFEVGRIVRNKCGEKAYLLNDKYYSSSTCKHQRCVRSAIPTVGDDGVLIKPLEEIPCPFCRTEEFIRYDPFNKEYSMDSEEDIRDWYMSYINEMRNKYGGK